MAREVEWMDWGKEAFDKAQAEDKPVLLDIMATWCHWCHVMDESTYSDPEVVDMIRERFVPIRVDTDARPDINARYNRGGWPTTAFLTPKGDLMGGSTYLPPAQMKQTMMEYFVFYRENKEAITEQAREARWNQEVQVAGTGVTDEDIEEAGLDKRVIERAIDDIRSDADLKHGGFGRAPKFPHPEAVDLALLWYHSHHDNMLLSLATLTLESMASGGIYDQLGGGFHRYAIDPGWRVPHFEKLLDVNSMMLSTYARAYAVTREELFRTVALGTMSFLENVLGTPEGAFYSSQNADLRSTGTTYDDGSYFAWTVDEIKAALPEDLARVAIAFYGITAEGDIEPPKSSAATIASVIATPRPDTPSSAQQAAAKSPIGRNVLHEAVTYDDLARTLGISVSDAHEKIEQVKLKLIEARQGRTAPSVDNKILTNWNALAAKAYFDGYGCINSIEHVQRALQVVDFLLANSIAGDGGTWHCLEPAGADEAGPAAEGGWRKTLRGQLCDVAPLVSACLDAYEASANRDYLERARQLVRYADEHLRSPLGGYFDGPPDPDALGTLSIRDRSIYDNSEMAYALARLFLFTGDVAYQDYARRSLVSLLPEYERAGYLAAGFVLAVDMLINYPVELVTVGPIDHPDTRALHQASLRLFEPRRLVQLLDPERDLDIIEKRGYAVTDRPTLFMCINNVCTAPIHDPEQVQEWHERFHVAASVGA